MRAEASSCTYAGRTAAGSTGGTTSLPTGKLGVECIANILKLHEAEISPPPGGCYRIAHATLVVALGHNLEKVAGQLKKGVKATHWPAGFTRQVLHGVGDRAEFGFDGTHGYGYLQVLNAQLTVEVTELGVIEVLRDAASQL